MQPGGVITPINGDLVVYHEPEGSGMDDEGQYVLAGYPGLSGGEAFPTYDAAVAAARVRANGALVNVFYCALPGQPELITQFRVL